MVQQETRQWLLVNKPLNDPVLSGPNATFKLTRTTLPDLNDDQVLLKVLYFSNDPAQRTWIQEGMDPERMYTTPVPLNAPMRSFGVCEVMESKAANLAKGSLVLASTGWSEYDVVNAGDCRPIHVSAGLSPTNFIGALGGPGLTACYGLIDRVGTTAEDAVVISGAAGATGSMAVQVAKKLIGCKKVIGIAGSDEKCRWVESLGADICVNYKSPSFKEDLKNATEGFVEVYFDNVGGEILDFMLTRVKRHGRIAACGAIAEYNRGFSSGLMNWHQIIFNRLEIKGFIITDARATGKSEDFIKVLMKGVKEGKIKIGPETETVVPTKFEDVPRTWMMLFEGRNQGKLVTQIV
ncbi:NAD(P)-binding protein [Glonium stellatum]|uniref:NAD(P)-binding protein n=1 Tax=Glonium stellatum TaxID=574774 RepID=A0A8E2JY34_9PEZI|nr:NAD(P)-binding protein [Glonium stellatum]